MLRPATLILLLCLAFAASAYASDDVQDQGPPCERLPDHPKCQPPPPPPPSEGCYTAFDGVRELDVAAQYGTGDSQIRQAITAAQTEGCRLYFTSTTFRHSGTLTLNGLSARGDGAGSVLQADNAAQSAVILTGANAQLRSVRLTSPSASGRLTTAESNGVHVGFATNALVEDVTVERMGSAGIGVVRSTATIYRNTVRDTLADGIHVTNCSTADVGYNTVTDTGDDLVGVVGYLSDGCQPVANVHHNVLNRQTWGRGVSCVGCRDSRITDNAISNSAGAGILVAREVFWNTYGVQNLEVSRNTVRNPAAVIDHWANIRGVCEGGSYSITNVYGSGNNLDSAKPGVRFDGVAPCTVVGISIGWFYGV